MHIYYLSLLFCQAAAGKGTAHSVMTCKEVTMNQLDTVSHMAAVIYAARTAGRDIKPDDQERFYVDAAQQAWGLYHAVGATQAQHMGG
jgi:hypothetical protein